MTMISQVWLKYGPYMAQREPVVHLPFTCDSVLCMVHRVFCTWFIVTTPHVQPCKTKPLDAKTYHGSFACSGRAHNAGDIACTGRAACAPQYRNVPLVFHL